MGTGRVVKLTTWNIMRRATDTAPAELIEQVKVQTRFGWNAVAFYVAHHPGTSSVGEGSVYAVRPPRMSPEMAHVLTLAREQGRDIGWVPLVDGKGSQSRTVGRGLTIEACQRHGWLDRKCNLTPAGRQAINAWEEKA